MEDSCPATPLIFSGRNSKSSLPVGLSSPESDGVKSPSRDSPDSRCVICLGRLQNKSFTDSCLHQFCFQCLLQWSKIKAECPLCKQPFKSIIHNVRSNLDYDQYHVEHTEPRYVLSDLMHSYNFDLIPVDRRFRYRSTMTRDYFRELAESIFAHSRRLPEDSYQISPLVPVDPAPAHGLRRSNRLHANPMPHRVRQRGTSDFRRNIYAQDLWVQDLADITGRYRECTPQFYRENPAQIHRIIPWLNREVNVLLSDCESHAAYVLSRIVSLLTQHSIRSREFREQIQSYFGERTDHFVHELYTFARSVYDIAGFDQNAVYGTNPNYAMEVQEISSSSDSDIEVLETIKTEEKHSKKLFRQGHKKVFLKRANESEPNSDEPVAGPSGISSSKTSESIEVCESDPEEVKVLDFVKPEPEIVTLSSGNEENAYSDLDTSNGEYAEVIRSHRSRYKREGERKRSRSSGGKGKCKSNGFGLKGKQKRKYMKSRRRRSSSGSSSESYCSSRSRSSDSSYSSSRSSSQSSRSWKPKKRKMRVSRKRLKRKANYKSDHRRRKSSSDSDRRLRKRVKSCVIVPRWPRDSSPLPKRAEPPSRLQSYWSMALSDISHTSSGAARKTKRKHRDSGSEGPRGESKSSERSARSESSLNSSRINTSHDTLSPGSGDLPSSSGIPSGTSTSHSASQTSSHSLFQSD